jgi:hypothetical protein
MARLIPMPAVSQGPEVIAVHIPKTAGTAFRRVLESVYGKENVEHDQSPWGAGRRGFAAWKRAIEAEVERRTSWPRVITGHFPLWKYERFLLSAFTIVWVREPAARVLSHYFSARARARRWTRALPPEQILGGGVPPERFMRVELSFDWWLRGYNVDDFDFVGIQEHFDEDVADLGRILGWPPVEIPVHNRTTTREYVEFRPSEELIRRIRAANEADVELYEQALELRRLRRRVSSGKIAGL